MKSETIENPITPVEAACRLGMQLDAAYRLIWVGKLRGQKAGGKWLVDPASVAERLKAREKRNARS